MKEKVYNHSVQNNVQTQKPDYSQKISNNPTQTPHVNKNLKDWKGETGKPSLVAYTCIASTRKPRQKESARSSRQASLKNKEERCGARGGEGEERNWEMKVFGSSTI